MLRNYIDVVLKLDLPEKMKKYMISETSVKIKLGAI